MAVKQKKKRSKKYSGTDAKQTAPVVLRVSAEERSPLKEWWLSYRILVRFITVAIGVLAAVALVIIGIIGLF
jgi:hypothetical protein